MTPCELAEANVGMVYAIAGDQWKKLGAEVDEYDDLVGDGMVGLMQAALRFDTNKGTRVFSVWAQRRVMGAIVDGFRTRHRTGYSHGKGDRIVHVTLNLDFHPEHERSAEHVALDRLAHEKAMRAVDGLPDHLRGVAETLMYDGVFTANPKTTEWRRKTLRSMTVRGDDGIEFLPYRGRGSGNNKRPTVKGRFVRSAA